MLECAFCGDEEGASMTIPVPTKWGTEIHWACCPSCNAVYPKEEHYANERCSRKAQLISIAQYAGSGGRVLVPEVLLNPDFVTVYDMDCVEMIVKEIQRQANRLRSLIRQLQEAEQWRLLADQECGKREDVT